MNDWLRSHLLWKSDQHPLERAGKVYAVLRFDIRVPAWLATRWES